MFLVYFVGLILWICSLLFIFAQRKATETIGIGVPVHSARIGKISVTDQPRSRSAEIPRGGKINGRIAVLYSNKDYGCEWDYDFRNKRFLRVDNTRFAVNIIVYSMTV